jgi:hypothetical protein
MALARLGDQLVECIHEIATLAQGAWQSLPAESDTLDDQTYVADTHVPG